MPALVVAGTIRAGFFTSPLKVMLMRNSSTKADAPVGADPKDIGYKMVKLTAENGTEEMFLRDVINDLEEYQKLQADRERDQRGSNVGPTAREEWQAAFNKRANEESTPSAIPPVNPFTADEVAQIRTLMEAYRLQQLLRNQPS